MDVVRRVMRPDPKTFGSIQGCPVGMTWVSRAELSASGVHPGIMKGINGTQDEGARSIVLNGGYEDDEDQGDTFTYTGSGGRTLKTRDGKNLRTGPQTHDQSFDHPPNRALYRSWQTQKSVRVVRGFNLNSVFAPADGYRYDGLYRVTRAWKEKGRAGFIVCRYTLERRPDQQPLPRLAYAQTLANVHKSARALKRQTVRRAPSPPVLAKDERPNRPNPPPLSFITDAKPRLTVAVRSTASRPSPVTPSSAEAGPSRLLGREGSDGFSVSRGTRPPLESESHAAASPHVAAPTWQKGHFKFSKRSRVIESDDDADDDEPPKRVKVQVDDVEN